MGRLNATAPCIQEAQQQISAAENSADSGQESVPDSSDKENSRQRSRTSLGKRKNISAAMANQSLTPKPTGNKRRKVDTMSTNNQSQSAKRKQVEKEVDLSYYDPDQNDAEKRETLKRYRELNSKVNDSKAEYIQRDSRGLQDAINEANALVKDVKQTSIATHDARLLVNVSDLAYRKVNTMTLGDTSTGIDVDDFISKCISYMRQGQPNTQSTATQRRRTQRDDDEEEDESLDLNWAYFGRRACFPHTLRPCLSSFLLGPLSAQKKVRQQSQRKATQARADPSQIVRPQQLSEAELDQRESANLTVVCTEIRQLLQRTQTQGEKAVEEEADALSDDEQSEEVVRSILRKHHICDNGGVSLVEFCVNPESFGQTVENFFYVSFLIKEGRVGLDIDGSGMPTLGVAEERTTRERQETQRNQAVFTLDYDTWGDLVKNCGITKSIIPHRHEEHLEELPAERVRTNVGADVDDVDSNDM